MNSIEASQFFSIANKSRSLWHGFSACLGSAFLCCFLISMERIGKAEPEHVIFHFVDKTGVVHFTDRLGDVPEPYHSMYKADLERQKKEKKNSPGVKRPVPQQSPSQPRARHHHAGPSIIDQEIKRRQAWRNLIQKWRDKLKAATLELKEIGAERDRLNFNPILRHTPMVKESLVPIEKKHAEALRRVEKAQKMLLETLPKRARKEGVPPKWLE